MSDLARFKLQRNRFLLRLYEETEGDTNRALMASALGAQIGMTEEESERAAQWLVERGLAKWFSMGGYLAITPEGADQAEEWVEAGDYSSEPEPAEAAQPAEPEPEQPAGDAAAYDLFISYASEDSKFVDELTAELQGRGLIFWRDKVELQIGDSLTRKLDEGLANSRFGVVVASPSYFAKPWPKAELRVLLNRHISTEQVVVLPIRLGMSASEITTAAPLLGDLFSVDSSVGVVEFANQIERRVRESQGGAPPPTPTPEPPPTPPSRTLDPFEAQHLAIPNSLAPPDYSPRALTARAVLIGQIPSPEPTLSDGDLDRFLDRVADSSLERLMRSLTEPGGRVDPQHYWELVAPRGIHIMTVARPAAPVRIYHDFTVSAQAVATVRPIGRLAVTVDVVIEPPDEGQESGTPLSLDDFHALAYHPVLAVLEVGKALLSDLNNGDVVILGVGGTVLPHGGARPFVNLGGAARERIRNASEPTAIHWSATSLDGFETPEQLLDTTRRQVRDFFITGGYRGYEQTIDGLTDRLG